MPTHLPQTMATNHGRREGRRDLHALRDIWFAEVQQIHALGEAKTSGKHAKKRLNIAIQFLDLPIQHGDF